MIFLENGTELDMSKLKNLKINISLPMNNLDSLNYDYATYFADQGYDIYDKNSDFYTNSCSPAYYGENDITLEDRRLEIYPHNASINKNNCSYLSVDLENKRLSYECDFTENYNNEEISEFDYEEKDNNFISYFLDLINYKIVFCINLFFNIDNYKNNLGIKICLIDFTLTTTLIIFFFIFGFKKIRVSFFNEIKIKQKEIYDMIQKKKNILITNNIKLKDDKNKNKNKDNKNNDNKKKEKEKDKNKIKNNKDNKDNKDKKDKKENKDINNKKNYNKDKKANPIKKNRNSKNLFLNTVNNRTKILTNVNILAQKSQINLILPKKFKISNNSKKNINIILDKKYKSDSQKKLKFLTQIDKKKLNNEKKDYDELTFNMALKIDKRNIFQLFLWKILGKIEIVDIFINKKIKSILLSKYFFYLLIDF